MADNPVTNAASRTFNTAPGRMIFGLMFFTMVFSLVGTELQKGQGQKPPVNPFLIIFGGTMATSLLTLISHAGEPGERVGVGLATVAFVTSTLVYGKPVWDAANKALGSKATTPLAASTPSTPSTGAIRTTAALAPTVAAGF
jgi:hypothetical protein